MIHNPLQFRAAAELAYIRAVPDLTVGVEKRGRLKGLYKRLQKAVDRDLAALPALSKYDMERLRVVFNEFGQATGWDGKTRAVPTLISFVICIVEDSPINHSGRILKILTDIYDYFERAGNVADASNWGGAAAAQKWEGIINGIT